MSILNKSFETVSKKYLVVYKSKSTSTKEIYTIALSETEEKPRQSKNCLFVLKTVEGGKDWWNTVSKVEKEIKNLVVKY